MNLAKLPLAGGNIGIEREMLRSATNGTLATTAHPEALGNVFTHPNITIDYAEALLEVVTDIQQSPQAVYQELAAIHRYTAQRIGNERLWPASMPCILPSNEADIAIGQFGHSNAGRLKRLYRVGLSHRYGRAMQMIAGVHFNYSPADAFWPAFAAQQGKPCDQAFIDDAYMSMIRTLHRYGWLICYLFGASPAVDDSFKPAQGVLDDFAPHTLGWENANTLRMSQLGYQNKVDFRVSFNSLSAYIHDLVSAVTTPAPAFEYLGLKDKDGNYQQISTNILQIANEYYTSARPKQPVKGDELPANALADRGIRYVELRLLDINPYDPCGVSLEQIYFLEAFMLWALITPEAPFTYRDFNEFNYNRQWIACCGRARTFPLTDNGKQRISGEWAADILEQVLAVAQTLDAQNHTTAYSDAVIHQREINANHDQGLAHRCHDDIKPQGYIAWAQALQEQHLDFLMQPIAPAEQQKLDALRDKSIAEFADIESRKEKPFADYLAHYFDALNDIR